MTFRSATAVASLLSVALVAAVVSTLSIPVSAATPTPTATGAAPITVVIPGDSTPSPSSSSGGGSGGSGSGGGGSQSGGGGESEGGGRNADGSPIPPREHKENAPKLKLDRDKAKARDWVVATASGYKPGEKAQLVLYPGAKVIASFTVNDEGTFSARFRIPEGTLVGGYVLEVTGWDSGYVTNAEITVVGEVLAANWLTLWWVYVVLGVLFLGILSVSIAFRREIGAWFAPPGVPESSR